MIDKKENGGTSSFSGKFRNAIYRTLSVCIDHNIINVPLYMILLLIELCMMLPYFYFIFLRVADKEPEALDLYSDIMDTIFSVTLNTTLLDASFGAVVGFAFAFLALFIGFIVIMVLLGNAQGRFKQLLKLSQKYGFLFKILSFCLKLLCTIGTLPACALLMLSYKCTEINGYQVFSTDHSIKCWSGMHIALVVASSIDILGLLIIILLIETMLYESNPKSTLPWASCGSNKGAALKHLAKAGLICFYLFDPTAEYYHYFFISQFIIHAFTCYLIFLAPPFVSRWVGYFTMFEHSCLLFACAWGYIVRLYGTVILYPGIIMITGIYVTTSILALFAKDLFDRYVLSQQSFDSKEVAQKEYYFYELFYYLDQYSGGDAQTIIVLNGLYMNHQRLCNNPQCQCMSNTINTYLEIVNKKGKNEYEGKDVAKLQGAEEAEKQRAKRWESMSSLFQVVGNRVGFYEGIDDGNNAPGSPRENNNEEEVMIPTNYQLLLNMTSSIIEHEVQSNIGCVPLRMISSFYAKEYIGNVFKAIYDLFYIEEKLKPSFQEGFLVYKAKKDVDDEIAIFSQKKAGDNVVDVESLIIFEEHYKKFRNYAEIGSNYANRFWELLKNKDLDVNGLYDIGSKVGELYTEMHKSYSVAIEIFPQNHKLVKELGYYEKHVMNNEGLANEFESEAKRIIQEQSEHTNETENNEIQIIKSTSLHHTCICVASGNPGSMGDLLAVNDEIQYSLGFKAKEIIGQNCAVLCPPYIGSKHNAMLENFIKNGTTNFLGNLKVVAACNNKGFLVTMDLVIKILPTIDRGLCFVSIFKKFDNYSLYFPNVHIPCYSSDFAMIVTTLEGQLIGITETCMTRFGIPVSIFKGGITNDESVTIQTLIKELNQPDIVEELKADGRKIEIDTKPFMYSINRENLPHSEAKFLESNVGKYTVFCKVVTETYSQNIKVQIFRMIILASDTQTPENEESAHKTLDVDGKTIGDEPLSQSAKNKPNSPNEGKESKADTGRKLTEEIDADAKKDLLQERTFNEIKQNINSKSSGMHVTTMNRWVHILILIILALASTEFGLLVTEYKDYSFFTDLITSANRRIIHSGLINSQVLANVNMTNSTSSPVSIVNVNVYEYLREYGFRSIGILNAAGSYINTAGFDYNEKLYALEKRATVNMVTLGKNSQITQILHTLNTAITQYTAKAADFMSFTFSVLQNNVVTAKITDPTYTGYFFIIKNGLGSLAEATQEAVSEYTNVMIDHIGRFLRYYIGLSIVIGVAVIFCFGIIVPKLVGVQSEKIHILLLYTQLNRNEISSQIAKCVEYQKISGFLEANEDVQKEESDSQDISNSNRRNSSVTPEGKDNKEDIEDLDSGEEKKKNDDENAENKDEADSDDDESENKNVDENEKTIYETMDTTKLNSKLTTNKFGLIVASIFVSALFCSYPAVSTIHSWGEAKEAKEMIEMSNGVSNLLKTPLYLLLYTLITIKDKQTLYVNNQEAINYYLDEFMKANAFTQQFSSSKSGYLSPIQKIYEALDNTQFCNQLVQLYSTIRGYYDSPQYTYSNQKLITVESCNNYESGILSRGLTQANYLIYKIVNKMQTELKVSRIPDTSDAINALYMLQLFLAPAIEGIIIKLDKSMDDNLSGLLQFMIIFYVVFILAAIATHFLFWTCFFKAMKEEIVRSRGMLKLMPMELIKKLKGMKGNGADITTTNSLKFFKQIQKKT